MYQSHFNFNNPPFRTITRLSGDFLVPYHQDVFNLLKEKTQLAGIIGLFCDDAPLLGQFIDALKASNNTVLAINAFPKLSASSLLYKLNPGTKVIKDRMQAVDAVLRQWQEGKAKSRVLTIAHSEAMKESCREVLGTLLTRAQELNFRLAVVLTGTADQEILLKQPELREYTHTHHALRPLTCREYLSYVQAQCEEHGCENSPLPPARVRKMHTLTKGNISKLNALAHLAMLAAWTERAAQVSPRHLRLAAGEILPAKKHAKRLATVGLFASVLFAACGWYLTSSIGARLPIQLPVPVSWKQQSLKVEAPVVPVIDNEIVNQPDAMHQLYLMWGYDASAEDALCQNAAKVNLMCKQGNASPETLAQQGYPWVSELKTSGHLNYAVVARVGDTSIDLLMNNRTWQVSRSWFNRHATGNFTQLHRLTPEGKDAIGAASDSKDMAWLDQQLSLALSQPETHARIWTTEMMKRTREFQQKMHLHVDGTDSGHQHRPGRENAGEESLMSTICLAAQRSYTTGEAVWFSYRLPSLKNVFGKTALWMVGLCAMLVVGLYMHVYWHLRHPAPEPVNASVAKPETQLSDMHYVPKAAPVPVEIPPMQDLPIKSDDANWQQAPDGAVPHDTSRDTLPGTEAHEHDTAPAGTNSEESSLTELFKQALKEQEQDYSQGKMPPPPVDETQDNVQAGAKSSENNRSPLSEKGERLE